jgi:hypothetical protein
MAKEVLKISTILRMFTEEGLTREEIRVKLDCTKTEITEIFRHEKLKNLKACTKKFLLVDDTEENYAEDTATVNDIPVKDAETLATVAEAGPETTSDEPDWIKEDKAVEKEAVAEAVVEEDSWEEEDKVIDIDSAPTAEELEDDEAWE